MILQVGVKVLLKSDNNKYLFLKRSANFKPGVQKWDIPGGRINVDEKLDEALAREVCEETGMELGKCELIAAQDIFAPDKDLHAVRLTYTAAALEESVTISNEHSEYKWMTKEEVIDQPLDSYVAMLFQDNSQL